MDGKRYLICWRDQTVGVVTDIYWHDDPWMAGAITFEALSVEIRDVLEYVGRVSETEEGLVDWPFPDELGDHWRLVHPDGEAVEISVPAVDFATGWVTWR